MNDDDGSLRKRATAADVARIAGVSRSAVSRAFSPKAYVDAEKRALIQKVARDLGYRPNALAASLQGANSNLVAIFAGEMPNDYDKEVTTRLVQRLNEIGKWPIMISGSESAARKAVSEVLRYPLEAMILRSGSLDEDIVENCSKLSIPVIASGRVLSAPGVDNICVRNAEGMRKGVDLLLARGRRRFGYLGGPPGFWSTIDRRRGVVDALAEAGLEPVCEETGGFSVETGAAATEALMARCDLDALVCANDAMAIGALSVLRARGHRVPDDISVIGFDDIRIAALPAFDLTTLVNPINPVVGAIVDLLERRLETPERPDEMIHLDAELVLRGTH